MTTSQQTELNEQGYTVLRSVVSEQWQHSLSAVIDRLLPVYQKPEGVLLHAICYHSIFTEFLQYLAEQQFFTQLERRYFHSKCILNSMSVIDNCGSRTFANVWHRDLRFFSGDLNIMLNALVMLDDFTELNGATLVQPYSHKLPEMSPTVYSKQILGNSGDILIFNSNLWHCGGTNNSGEHRRSIPITISRPFMKQLMDYPRAIGYDKQQMFSTELQQLLGYYSRVPASINEWDQPENQRMYRKDQDITI